ncbi:hypothetical protein G6F36_012724 [Rhizopus arrhizus]|nr:hypothetical protein G6F36_012724 [Rhizopus arrhizus]
MSNWENLNSNLHVPNYWSSKTCIQWSSQDFCHNLLQANPFYSKRSAMALFSEDLEVIQVQLAHHKLISSRVKALVKLLSKKDELLDQFWAEYSTNIKSISLKRKYNVFVSGSLLEEEAIETLQKQAAIKKSLGEELGSSIQTDDDGAAQEVDQDDMQDARIEHDDCSVDDRQVMTNGLSSILDLCDQSLNSQQWLFSLKQWHELLERFSFLKLQSSCLNKQVLDTIRIVTNCCQPEGNMTSAVAYTKALKDQAERAEDMLAYKIAKHSLKLLGDYPLMLIKSTPINYTESDYLLVRIKTGESIFSTSTASKKGFYPDAKDIRGFKIDIRFVVDVGRKEIDVAVAEVAKNDSKDKTISDQEKLLREGKDIVDAEIIKPCHAYLLQITCSDCILKSAYEKDTGRAYQQEREKEQENPDEYDMYGWKRRNDGKFHNKFSKTVADEYPVKRNEKEKQIAS